MQILITSEHSAQTRVLMVRPWLLLGAASLVLFMMLLIGGAIYHMLFMAAARQGWPVAGNIVRNIMQKQLAQRDQFVRENLDAMAKRVGELQAQLIQLEAKSERVAGLAGVKPEELAPAMPQATSTGAQGGPYLPAASNTQAELNRTLNQLFERSEVRSDVFALIESRLFEKKLDSLMIPSSPPVNGATSSGFGFRSDPFTGHAALHAGLDFPGAIGTAIHAAAGGVVIAAENHPDFGNMIMIDHGNELVTLYAHASRLLVHPGDVIKRGQEIAEMGSTGRSTGSHLHFEVHVNGVPQNPAKFLYKNNPEIKPVAMAGDKSAASHPQAP